MQIRLDSRNLNCVLHCVVVYMSLKVEGGGGLISDSHENPKNVTFIILFYNVCIFLDVLKRILILYIIQSRKHVYLMRFEKKKIAA